MAKNNSKRIKMFFNFHHIWVIGILAFSENLGLLVFEIQQNKKMFDESLVY